MMRALIRRAVWLVIAAGLAPAVGIVGAALVVLWIVRALL